MRRIAQTILIAILMVGSVDAVADDRMAAALASLNVAESASTVKKPASDEIGVAASEVLPGNGSRAGYVLGHGNVIPESEWVYIGARRAARNKDYTIDYASGTLFFSEPVRRLDSVRVDYRYSEKGKGERNVTGPGTLPFRLGNALQMNMVYSYRAADPDAGYGTPDILTYGANTTTKLGASSTISSMMYMASPQASDRLSITANPKNPGKQKEVKKDRLMLQNADLGLGKVRLKLGFQDVGEDFAGFASLRESKAAPDDVLNQLEKEKGIKRMNVDAEIPTGKNAGFTFSMGSIGDKKDDIMSRAFGYNSDNLRFSFSTRDVGKDFSRFKNLKEADRAQLAAEAGIKRTSYGLQFRSGSGADGKTRWSGLGLTQLNGETGSLSHRTVDLDFGKLKVQADVRTVDPTFNRMAALNDEERTRMALIARRQFDPNAQAADVTAQDKARINQEAGLDRANYLVRVDDSWLSLSSVDSEKGGLSRSAINFNTKRFGLYFNHQSIDANFDRLANLQPIERLRFGNEYGMTRTELGGRFGFAGGKASFSRAKVVDHQGAGILRQGFDFNSPRLKFRANFQDIDAEFSRIMDLSDKDRKLLVKERGFRRSDYWINFQAAKNLNIDSYIYNSTNVTAGQARDQVRHKIVYTPSKGREITFFRDNFSYVSDEGNLSSYARQKITFDTSINLFGGLRFQGLNDLNTVQEGDELPLTTSISHYRLQSDQNAPTSFSAEYLNVDHGDGRHSETKGFGFKTKAVGNASLVGSYASTSGNIPELETNASIGVEWPISKDLSLVLKLANRDGGPKGSQQSHQLALKGLLAKRFLFLDNIKIDSSANSNVLTGRQTGCDNALKIEAGFLGGNLLIDNSDKLNPKNGIYYTSRIIRYESDKDPKKWYHLTFFRQRLVTPTGEPATKRNYALDMRFSPNTSLTLTSYFGKDAKKGAVLPIGGTVLKFNHSLGKDLKLFADYSTDVNEHTHRRARVAGIGFSGVLSNKAVVEFYIGRASLVEGLNSEQKTVFRVQYDHKMDADHYITLTAQRRSGIEKNSINPYEGDTTARLDFRMLFD